VQEEDERGALK